MNKLIILFFFPFVFNIPAFSSETTSTFNEQWFDAVVSIEVEKKDGNLAPIGTGFIVSSPKGNPVLVTAKHIYERNVNNISKFRYILGNANAKVAQVKESQLVSRIGGWILNEQLDLALRFFAWPVGYDAKIFIPDNAFIEKNTLRAGAPVVVLGFPLGLRNQEYTLPILRGGTVARVEVNQITIDSNIFPGNSGGPVIYMPTVKLGGGLKSNLINEEKLIGVVANYIPYTDIAVSTQTGTRRVAFEENSGLSMIVPAWAILEMMNYKQFKELDKKIEELR